ncbi:hypothetical protein [Nodularia sp. NIES-3585]|uniref:hypothetical protein n=1 Tax=Nodularia sp. NIES-3585 TaxID=1973477 RepID=UPI0020CFA664|nr:hypothetical protein [Nodularia sp. NIES-3585]
MFTVQHTTLAQSVDVPFSGNVPVQATFTEIISPPLEPVIVDGADGLPTQFEPQSPATVTVETSTNATITVSAPVLVSGASEDPPGTIKIGYVRFSSTTASSDVGGGNASLPAGTNDLEVSMLVERPTAFLAGDYTYTVTLTITP